MEHVTQQLHQSNLLTNLAYFQVVKAGGVPTYNSSDSKKTPAQPSQQPTEPVEPVHHHGRAKDVSHGYSSSTDVPSPEETAAWYSVPTHSYMTPFIRMASRRTIEFPDIFRLQKIHRSAINVDRLQKDLDKTFDDLEQTKQKERPQASSASKNSTLAVDGDGRDGDTDADKEKEEAFKALKIKTIKWTLFKSLFWSYPGYVMVSLALHGVSSLGNIVSPIILSRLLDFLQNPEADVKEGYLWSFALLVAQTMVAFG
jgi:hypothetical protein